MKWMQVTPVQNIPVRQGRVVRFGSIELAIFNLGGAFRAVESRCPHKQGPLADGIAGAGPGDPGTFRNRPGHPTRG